MDFWTWIKLDAATAELAALVADANNVKDELDELQDSVSTIVPTYTAQVRLLELAAVCALVLCA